MQYPPNVYALFTDSPTVISRHSTGASAHLLSERYQIGTACIQCENDPHFERRFSTKFFGRNHHSPLRHSPRKINLQVSESEREMEGQGGPPIYIHTGVGSSPPAPVTRARAAYTYLPGRRPNQAS